MVLEGLERILAELKSTDISGDPALVDRFKGLVQEFSDFCDAMDELDDAFAPEEEELEAIDSEQAIQWLEDPDPEKRVTALSVLQHHRNREPWFFEKCEQMAFEEGEKTVRDSALGGLGTLYEGTNDVRLGRRLAGIVHCQSEPILRRYVAYNNLFRLRGLSWDTWPIMTKPWGKFVFPDDVDWLFVNSFLRACLESLKL